MRKDRRDQVLRVLALRSRGAAARTTSALEWPERLSGGLWWTSPDLVSLAGTEVFQSMPLDQQQALEEICKAGLLTGRALRQTANPRAAR